jgi:phosphatidylserine/phosphatidylglycerophosphate/cardiolipin synthase-like enzyme
MRMLPALLLLAAIAGPAPAGGDKTEPRLSLGPDENPIVATRRALDEARESVSAVIYKFDEPGLLEAVSAAVRRGVRVRLLIDGAQVAGNPERSLAARAQAAGAEVRLWPEDLHKLHAKLTVVDGKKALTGSYNWTRSALEKNVELLIVFEEPATVRRLSGLFEVLWERAASPVPVGH